MTLEEEEREKINRRESRDKE